MFDVPHRVAKLYAEFNCLLTADERGLTLMV